MVAQPADFETLRTMVDRSCRHGKPRFDERIRGRPEHNQLQLALVQVQGAAAERRDEDEDEFLDSLDVDVESRAAPHGVGVAPRSLLNGEWQDISALESGLVKAKLALLE